MTKLLTGWTIRGRPFSRAEFNRSHIKKSRMVTTYTGYLKAIAILSKKRNSGLR